jgi:anti-sigma B factor antagonist
MTHLDVELGQQGDVKILRLKGFLDAHTHHLFKGRLEECLSDGTVRIVVDFRELSYIGSSGIEVILARVQGLRDAGGDIVLSAMSPRVYKVFDLLGLPSFFRILQTEAEAVEAFR